MHVDHVVHAGPDRDVQEAARQPPEHLPTRCEAEVEERVAQYLQGAELAAHCAPHARAHLSRAISVTLFGSLARGEGDERSDLDVLVVWGEECWGEETFLPAEHFDAVSAFEAAVFAATGWPVESISLRFEDAAAGLGAQVGVLPAAALEGLTLAGTPLAAFVDHEITLDAAANRRHQLARLRAHLAQWSRSLELYEEMHRDSPQQVSIEVRFLWELGSAAAEILLTTHGCRRMGERRAEEGVASLASLACTELGLAGTAEALERLHDALRRFEDAEELTASELAAARTDAALLRALAEAELPPMVGAPNEEETSD